MCLNIIFSRYRQHPKGRMDPPLPVFLFRGPPSPNRSPLPTWQAAYPGERRPSRHRSRKDPPPSASRGTACRAGPPNPAPSTGRRPRRRPAGPCRPCSAGTGRPPRGRPCRRSARTAPLPASRSPSPRISGKVAPPRRGPCSCRSPGRAGRCRRTGGRGRRDPQGWAWQSAGPHRLPFVGRKPRQRKRGSRFRERRAERAVRGGALNATASASPPAPRPGWPSAARWCRTG